MSSTLRVVSHPRGHIASCNGAVSLVQARAERYQDAPRGGREVAMLVEARGEREREKKIEELAHFRSRVKERVRRREKAASPSEVVWSEYSVLRRATSLEKDNEKPPTPDEVTPDVHIIGGCAVPRGHPSMVQVARRTLLAQSADKRSNNSHCLERSHCVDTHDSYLSVSSEGMESAEQTASVETGDPNREQLIDSGHKAKRRPKCTAKLSAPGQLEHAQRQQAGAQYLLFRRLYSDLEREQARQRSQLLAHRQRVQQLKRVKEGGRQLAEEEMNTPDYFSVLSVEESEEQERAAEWAELVALEERRHQLQQDREGERYVAALRRRLKERLAQHHCSLPPLCSCGTTIWDTNPETCANNCVFYRNPKGCLSGWLHAAV